MRILVSSVTSPDQTIIEFTDIDVVNLYQAISTQLKPEYTHPRSCTADQLRGMQDMLRPVANAAFNR